MDSWVMGILLFANGGLMSALGIYAWRRARRYHLVKEGTYLFRGDAFSHLLTAGIEHQEYVATISAWATRGSLPSASKASIAFLPLIASALEKRGAPITNADAIESFVAGHAFTEAVPELLFLLYSDFRTRCGSPLAKTSLEETTTETETSSQSFSSEGTFGWEEGTRSTHCTYKVHWSLVTYAIKRPLADGALRALTKVRDLCSPEVQLKLDAAVQAYSANAPSVIEVRERASRELISEEEEVEIDRSGRNL